MDLLTIIAKINNTIKKIRINLTHPSDVMAENRILNEVVTEVNRDLARDKKLEFQVIYWQLDSHPGLHSGGPQIKIDEDLKFEDADLVIGIFKSRFGTPVNGEESGTAHELKKSIDLWRKNEKPQVFIYFSQASIKR